MFRKIIWLSTQFFFDVIFIQESSWSTFHSILSSKSKEDNELVGVSNHPNWLIFAKSLTDDNNSPRVIICINIRLSFF